MGPSLEHCNTMRNSTVSTIHEKLKINDNNMQQSFSKNWSTKNLARVLHLGEIGKLNKN